jgi:hypothetical protein
MTAVSKLIHTLTIVSTLSVPVAGCTTAPDDDPAVASTENALSVSQWSANVQIGGLSAQSPALAALNGVAHLNHSGNSDGVIWWATYTPGHWDPNVRIGTQASSATPSLAAFNGFVYMTHLGSDSGATQVWFDRFNPSTWSWRQDSPLSYTSVGSPTIAAYGSKLYVIGVTPGSHQLWSATMDASESFTSRVLLPGMFSGSPPSLAVLNNRLYMAHLAGSSPTAGAMVLNSFDGTSWGPDVVIPGGFNGGPQLTPDQPSIAAYGGVLHLVHRETTAGSGPGSIWWSYYTPSTGVWSAEVALPGQRMDGFAALAALPTQLLMVHHGSGDNGLWYSVFQ